MRLYVITTATLAAIIGVLVGVLVSTPRISDSAPVRQALAAPSEESNPVPVAELPSAVSTASTSINFADIAARMNPAVVNIDATARTRRARRLIEEGGRRGGAAGDPFDLGRRGDAPRRGTGTGFLIDAEGHVLTNHHVIEGAERLTVKLAGGRTLRATVVGSDPDTDIALIKVDGTGPFPHAVLGAFTGFGGSADAGARMPAVVHHARLDVRTAQIDPQEVPSRSGFASHH